MTNRLLPIGLLILAVGIAYFYMYPAYENTITPDQQQVTTYNAALAAAQQFTQNEQALTVKTQAISQTDLARLQSYIPDTVDKIHFISDMNHLANSYGVSLSGFTLTDNSTGDSQSGSAQTASSTDSSPTSDAASQSAPSSSTGTVESLDMQVSASGTYDALQSFLMAVEQSAPVLDVSELSIKGSTTGVYSYTMTIRTYWLQ